MNMSNNTHDFVFVVLVYRNTNDLVEFFANLSLPNTKVIVVNSYYDEESEKAFKEIAENNAADFISVPNKGYGAGNNRGCEFALKNYKFRYLIISNADIEVKQMDLEQLIPYEDSIIAPKTLTLTGKNQNPFMIRHHPYIDGVKNWAFKNNYRKVIKFFSMFSRIEREFYLKVTYPMFHNNQVYAAHGAFVIIPYSIINKLCPIYNEKMFLFAEEEHLAQMAKCQKIPIVYLPQIKVLHKEDGSTGAIGDNFKYIRESCIEFYNYWYNK